MLIIKLIHLKSMPSYEAILDLINRAYDQSSASTEEAVEQLDSEEVFENILAVEEPEDLSFKLTRQEKSFRPRSQQLKPETIPEPEKQTKTCLKDFVFVWILESLWCYL